MKYYLIAGEASGDLHASNLMRGLQACDPACEIRFWGGDAMAAVGGTQVRSYRDTAMMGYTDVLRKARKVLGGLAFCKKDILDWHPDAVVLVDYPGFNLKVAHFAHRQGFKVFWYIAPKVWAHFAGRVKKLRRDVDVLYSIFPFELEWFRERGIEPRYFGNPLLDRIAQVPLQPMDGPRIALLPGSRKMELKFLMPRLVELERLLSADTRFASYRLTLAGAPSLDKADYQQYLPPDSKIEVVFGRTYEILAASEAAVISSGTASLEAALLGTPQVVCYGSDPFSWFIARLTVRVPHVSLANLTLGRRIFPELLQEFATPAAIFRELERILLDGQTAARMRTDYEELRKVLGSEGASGRIAQDMYHEITRV